MKPVAVQRRLFTNRGIGLRTASSKSLHHHGQRDQAYEDYSENNSRQLPTTHFFCVDLNAF
jgi:hypothetical protein